MFRRNAKTIAFELVGDIFTLPIDGGQAKLISAGWRLTASQSFLRMDSGSPSFRP